MLHRFHRFFFSWRHVGPEEFVALLLVVFVIASPASAATRFQERSLFVHSARPGVTTSYTVSFKYMSPDVVGAVDMLFCLDPIPYMPCDVPPGLDVSGAVLSSQSGETGFSITTQTPNHLTLSRTPGAPTSSTKSSYTFDNIVNPTSATQAFSIRLKSHGTTDTSGPQIDFGSVRSQITNDIVIETQVPPMLMFCVARVVEEDCSDTDDTYYSDMGEIAPDATLTAQSEMSVGTNATAGFAITAIGSPLSAGTSVVDSPNMPTPSLQGTNQFGINLVANTEPIVGGNPTGTWLNALPTPDYGTPNMYKFVSGDVVASSPNVSLMKKFTVSYILNSQSSLKAGVYTTTITYVASGRF